jgi:hypothetical protein
MIPWLNQKSSNYPRGVLRVQSAVTKCNSESYCYLAAVTP